MTNTISSIVPQNWRDRYQQMQRLLHKINAKINTEQNILLGKLRRLLFPIPWPNSTNKQINLHLGCGLVNHPKFINIDGLPAPHVHYVRAINNLSCFPNENVDLIYASHCLEHFSHWKTKEVLAEWFRVLKKDGILRISVPDFDLLLNIYQDSGHDIESIIYVLMGGQDYKYNFHLTTFNKRSLTALLQEVGFSKIAEWQPGSCDLTTFNDHSTAKLKIHDQDYPVSLNLQAIK